jgi:hypothetical protein
MNSIDVLAIGVSGIMTIILLSCFSSMMMMFIADNNDLNVSDEENTEQNESFDKYQKYCFEN